MKAILHTGMVLDWVPDPAHRPWMLLPVGNRPVLEYWFECCVALGIQEVRLVLGEGADLVEQYAGDGENWGLDIQYGFLKPGDDPDRFPRRSPDRWRGDGLLYVRAPAFPLRSEAPVQLSEGTTTGLEVSGTCVGFLTRDSDVLNAFLDEGVLPGAGGDTCGIRAAGIETPKAYFDLNMTMVRGDIRHYLAPGYSLQEGSYVGFNVVIPPSCRLNPPLMIGNHCRFQPLSVLGPRAVIGNRVVVDTQTELADCVVLDGTYLGKNLEFRNKILAGRYLIDPESAVTVELEDPLLLGALEGRHPLREIFHSLLTKGLALLLLLVQAPFFFLLYALLRAKGGGSFQSREVLDCKGGDLRIPRFSASTESSPAAFFRALNLDRWPLLPFVLTGRMALCGHLPIPASSMEDPRKELPRFFPGVYADELLLPQPVPEQLLDIYARNYLHEHRAGSDLEMLFRVLTRRLLCNCPSEPDKETDDAP